jgi:hypothetical protein
MATPTNRDNRFQVFPERFPERFSEQLFLEVIFSEAIFLEVITMGGFVSFWVILGFILILQVATDQFNWA